MGRKLEEKEIDGMTVIVTPFSAGLGLELGTELFKLIGTSAGRGLQNIGSILDDDLPESGVEAMLAFADKAGPVIGEALYTLADRVKPKELVSLAKRLLANTTVDGKEVGGKAFDVVFQGGYGTLFKVLRFVVEVNFSIPLGGWLTKLGEMRTQMVGENSSDS